MMPVFANPAGLWVLLGVPAILAIHFLQQRARVVRTSTWFLIEKLAPDSARGRTWDRLRSSRQLWLQLLSVILAAWVLAEPRWIRAESAQTVVIVLDASASMDAFRGPALAAAEREMNLTDGLAARTTWVIMTTDPRQPPLYRGPERTTAGAALATWQPQLGRHDLGPALRLARNLAGATGRTLLITDSRAKVPPDQRAAGVGHPIDNVGFAGVTVTRDEQGHTWRALVKNHAATSQRRTWRLSAGGVASEEQTLELAPGALTEISARMPDGVDAAMVELAGDGFSMDDQLPIARPRPKPLAVSIEGKDDAAEFFRKVASGVEGATVLENSPIATLRLARLNETEVAQEPRGGIFWPPADERAQAPLMPDPITPERDALVGGLNWQGWIGTGMHGFSSGPGDVPLLWQGKWPIVFLRTLPAVANPPGLPATQTSESGRNPGRKLMLAFDWATSNAARLPSTVLLTRRFLETERDAQRAPYTANFDSGALVPLAGVPADAVLTLTFEPAAGDPAVTRPIAAVERSELRAPGRAGFFTVQNGPELVVRGAAQFADARQGDFRTAERFFVEIRSERDAAIERNTTPDPFVIGWLALLVGLVLWSWWTRGSRGEAVATATTRTEVMA